MDALSIFSNPATVGVLIPLTGVIVWGVLSGLRMYFRHQERIEMIRSGMHPDSLTAETESGEPNDDA